MNIVSIQYSLTTKAIELYLAGCSGQPKCKNCHNPELWNFDVGEHLTDEYYDKRIGSLVKDFSSLIKNIMVFGGEPLDQDIEELIYLLRKLRKLEKPVWIFTRFSLDETKDILQDKLTSYDKSINVNSFYYKEDKKWLNKDTRIGLQYLINCGA